ncbi:MAG TPA: hypothetical protein VNW54_01340 [Granulicella sp.]|nr:hypothetical protein [Granulicella sp.]
MKCHADTPTSNSNNQPATVQIQPLAPAPNYANHGAPVNNDPLVLHLRYGQASVLLEGDTEAPSERAMLAAGAITLVTLLKVGHHGSLTSTTAAFFAAAAPQDAVISVGRRNPFSTLAPRSSPASPSPTPASTGSTSPDSPASCSPPTAPSPRAISSRINSSHPHGRGKQSEALPAQSNPQYPSACIGAGRPQIRPIPQGGRDHASWFDRT